MVMAGIVGGGRGLVTTDYVALDVTTRTCYNQNGQ